MENVTTDKKVDEKIDEMSKREEQFDTWEQMKREAKRKQREDRRLNVFWRKNKCFPAQFGSNEDTPDTQETLEFWRSINNKVVTERWREDETIQEVLREVRENLEEGDVDGRSSRKKSSTKSSGAQHRGRRAVLTACIPSPSRSANPLRRLSSSL